MKRLFYVTVKDGPKLGWLLGPYRTHKAARANVERGRTLACEANAWAWFYSFGTCSLPADMKQPRVVFADKMKPERKVRRVSVHS